MITLFKPDETDFTHNGIGNLDYYIINPIVEEVLNGIYKFTFKYPLFAPHGLDIVGQSILRVPVPNGEDQLFRVYRPVKSMGYITVSCYHIFYDLADNFIEDTNIVEKDGAGALQQIGNNTQFGHRFRFFSDIPTKANARLVRKNVVASILDDEQSNSFISRWGGELVRDNFDVRMNKSAGTNRGFEVKYRKNLISYEVDPDYSTVATRIMPKGFDGLLLPEKYIDSPLINNYLAPKVRMIDYDVKAAIGQYAEDEDALPLEEAYAELRRLAEEEYTINKVDIPKTNYKVDFVTLEKTVEYESLSDLQKLSIGDMFTVDHEDDGFKVTAKLVRYQYDPLAEKFLLAELGSIHGGITSNTSNINAIHREVSNLKEQTLIMQSTADGKNTIYRGEPEPSNPNVGDLWYKPNGSETQMYQYVDEDGVKYWKLLLDTGDLTQVQKDVDEAIKEVELVKDRAEEAYDNANLATQNAVEAIGKAQEGFDAAQQAITSAGTANTKADQSLSQAQSAFDKAQESLDGLSTIVDITDEQGRELTSIKGSVKGLQASVTDLDGNLATLQTTSQSLAGRLTDAEGRLTTVSATVQGLQTQVSDVESNVSTVTQLANAHQISISNIQGNVNRLTQTVDSTVSKIESFDNRNYLLNSDFDKGYNNWTRTIGSHVDYSIQNVATGYRQKITPNGKELRIEKTAGDAFLSQDITSIARDTDKITVSFYVYQSVDATGYLRAYLKINDSTFIGTSTQVPSAKGELFKHVQTFDVSNHDIEKLRLQINLSDYVGAVWIQAVKLTTGELAGDWKPGLEDDFSRFSEITQTISDITQRVQDADGNIGALQTTAKSLAGRLTDAEGNVATMTATINGMQDTVSNVEGDLSSVTQLANAHQTKISNLQGDVNTLTLTAKSLTSRIDNIGNRNYLKNSDFSDGTNGWIRTVGSHIDYKTPNVETGYRQKITPNGKELRIEKTAGDAFLSQDISSIARDTDKITVSFYVYQSVEATGYLRAYLKINDDAFIGSSTQVAQTKGILIKFTQTYDVSNHNIDEVRLVLNLSDYVGAVWIQAVSLVTGDVALDWEPSPDDAYSQFSQLQDAINLRVKSADLISQINLDKSGILISGKKLILDGDTTVTGNFRVRDANIASVDAGKMTTGTLNAAQVSIINLNANNIRSGVLRSIEIDGVNITGGKITQQRGTHKVELSDGEIRSYRSGNLAMKWGGWAQEFYNTDGTLIGTISPTRFVDDEYYGLGIDVEHDYLSIGHVRDGIRRPVFRTQDIEGVRRTVVAGMYDARANAEKDTELFLGANSRYALPFQEPDTNRVRHASMIIRNKPSEDNGNSITMYVGGYGNFKTDQHFEIRANRGEETSTRIAYFSRESTRFLPAYETESTFTTNMVRVNTIGELQNTSSSRRFKLDEKVIDLDYARRILNLDAKLWDDKKTFEETGERIQAAGLIAEDTHDAGLDLFVSYDKENRPHGLSANLWTLLIPIVKNHEGTIHAQQKTIESLVLKVAQLEQRINKLECA